METMQFYLQHFGEAVINNEYSVTIPQNAYLKINWFPHNDLFINGIKINTDTIKREQQDYLAIQIDPHTFIVRPVPAEKTAGEVKIDFENADTIVAGKYIIDKKTKEYETAEKVDILPNDFVAVRPLLTKLEHTAVIKSRERFVARAKSNRYAPQTNFETAQCFLECVRVGDRTAAMRFLSFAANAEQLKNYFGAFEILPFNGAIYIHEQRKSGYIHARKFTAEIADGKITNFNLI
jgi:hypothetical protein